MSSLIPDFIIKKCKCKSMSGNLNAFTMFADISGFTEMTQKLSNHGKEGAEILSGIINSIFSPCIESIYHNGGFISTFAGDAFTSIFHIKKAEYVLRTAFTIRELFERKGVFETKFGNFKLLVKIGLSFGNVKFRILDAGVQKAYYFCGEAINNCAESEHRARSMQIVADRIFSERLSANISKRKLSEGFYQFNSTVLKLPIKYQKKEHLIFPDIEKQFLPDSVIELNHKGEFREIISCFINFSDKDRFDDGIKKILEICHAYGGYFNRIDFGDKEGVILVLFGAPSAKEKVCQKAFDFILSISDISDFKFRAGLAQGTAFAGYIGSKLRKEYTAMGSIVNLSARLMMKADWMEILASAEITAGQQKYYTIANKGKMLFKGFSEKLEVFALKSKKRIEQFISYESSFVGRKAETKMLRKYIRPIFRGIFGGILYIDGPAGIGKSRFISNFSMKVKNCNFFFLPCDEIFRKSFNPFSYFLKNYFNQSESYSEERNKRNFQKIYRELIKKTANKELKNELRRTESVIGALIGLGWENSIYSKLDSKSIYTNTLFAVKYFILANSLQKPLILIIEDIHFIDNDSIELVKVLIRNTEKYPFVLVALCRPQDDGTKTEYFKSNDKTIKINTARLELNAFSREHLSELASDMLTTKNIPGETLDFIWEKSGGNPFYIEQIILYLKDNKFFDCNFNLNDKANEVPPGISQIIISRIDRLSYSMKETLKTASVLGREFALKVLERMLKSEELILSEKEFNRNLEEGYKGQIWEKISELMYIFKHAIIRDSLYEIQLKERLRNLHDLAGFIIEELYQEDIGSYYQDLAEHFQKANNIVKSVYYLEKSGNQAKERYQNEKALHYFGRLLKILDESQDICKIINIMLKKASILEIIGNWSSSLQICKEALTLAEKVGNDVMVVECLNNIGDLLRMTGEMAESINFCKKALKISKSIDFKRGIGSSYGSLAKIYQDQGIYKKALSYYEKQITIYREIGDSSGIGSIFNNIGLINWNKGNYGKALEYFQKSMKIYKESGDKFGYSKILCNTGLVLWKQGNLTEALKFFEHYLSAAQELGDKSGISLASGNIGILYNQQGEYSKSLEYYKKALSIFEELGDKRRQGIAWGNMGLLYSDLFNYKRALECYLKSIKIAEDLGDKISICRAMGNIGVLYQEQGKFSEALKYHRRHLKISTEIDNKESNSHAKGNMGIVFMHQGKYEKAMECYQDQLKICREIGDKAGISRVTSNIGTVYKCRGEYSKAIEYFNKALSLFEKINDKRNIIVSNLILGEIYHYKKDNKCAMVFFNKAEHLSHESEINHFLCEILYNKANLLYEDHDIENAAKLAEKAFNIAQKTDRLDIKFKSKILLCKMNQNISCLLEMLKNESNIESRALLNYELWKMTQNDQNRKKALAIYKMLYKSKGEFSYIKKISELKI